MNLFNLESYQIVSLVNTDRLQKKEEEGEEESISSEYEHDSLEFLWRRSPSNETWIIEGPTCEDIIVGWSKKTSWKEW